MNRLIKFTLAGILLLCSSSAMAQQKFGYLNSQEIIMLMPEMNEVRLKLETINKDYVDQIEIMQVELNTKLQDFQKNSAGYTAAMRQMKERELQELQVRIEEFYNTANQDISQQQEELLVPVYDRANEAIQKVGRDHGFFAIFDQAARATIYVKENDPNMVNITALVKAELGIKE